MKHWHDAQESANKRIAKRLDVIIGKVNNLLDKEWDNIGHNTRDQLVTIRIQLANARRTYGKEKA